MLLHILCTGRLSPALGRKAATVKYDIRLNAMLLQCANSLHTKIDVCICIFPLCQILGASVNALVQPAAGSY